VARRAFFAAGFFFVVGAGGGAGLAFGMEGAAVRRRRDGSSAPKPINCDAQRVVSRPRQAPASR